MIVCMHLTHENCSGAGAHCEEGNLQCKHSAQEPIWNPELDEQSGIDPEHRAAKAADHNGEAHGDNNVTHGHSKEAKREEQVAGSC